MNKKYVWMALVSIFLLSPSAASATNEVGICIENPTDDETFFIFSVTFKWVGGETTTASNIELKPGKKTIIKTKLPTGVTVTEVVIVATNTTENSSRVLAGPGTCENTVPIPSCTTILCDGGELRVSQLNGCLDCVPAVSTWGMIAMLLLMLTVGSIAWRRVGGLVA